MQIHGEAGSWKSLEGKIAVSSCTGTYLQKKIQIPEFQVKKKDNSTY